MYTEDGLFKTVALLAADSFADVAELLARRMPERNTDGYSITVLDERGSRWTCLATASVAAVAERFAIKVHSACRFEFGLFPHSQPLPSRPLSTAAAAVEMQMAGRSFRVAALLGSGAFSKVWLLIDSSGHSEALKVVPKRRVLEERLALHANIEAAALTAAAGRCSVVALPSPSTTCAP